ncbi:MAG: GNAT family N-acetyltransferase [Anaerolineales bacterium]|nr:GNAT family N-acetyltransferase [Anaerolineae bacterium]PWB73723.1 MAG: GNAT family N-acetyltransferase [Anaerolineales bacterium]
MRDLFRGELVRLAAEEPETRAKREVHWQRDSEFHRLADSEPAMMFSEKRLKEWVEKQMENGFEPQRYPFSIRSLEEDELIGFIGLWVDLIHNEAWVGIGIGERGFWGRGYGTDAMKLCLQYAFTELNVHRVSLGLHSYNPRALRSYEKAGFKLEGCTRKDIRREGRYTDGLWMGILREEWFRMQSGEAQ